MVPMIFPSNTHAEPFRRRFRTERPTEGRAAPSARRGPLWLPVFIAVELSGDRLDAASDPPDLLFRELGLPARHVRHAVALDHLRPGGLDRVGWIAVLADRLQDAGPEPEPEPFEHLPELLLRVSRDVLVADEHPLR